MPPQMKAVSSSCMLIDTYILQCSMVFWCLEWSLYFSIQVPRCHHRNWNLGRWSLVPANDADSEDGRHIQLMHRSARRRNVIRDSDTDDDVLECAVAPNKLKQHRQYSLRQRPADDHQESDNKDDDDVPPCPTAQCRRRRKQSIRMPWSNKELALLQRAFANFWHCKTLPGYAIINKAQKQFPVLQKRKTYTCSD